MKRMLLLLLALAVSLSGCGAAQSQVQYPLIYYADYDTLSYGSPALCGEAWTDAPESPDPEDYVNRMLEPPTQSRLSSVFPEQLRLLSWTEEDGVLTLDFSEEYSELTGIALTLANSCLTLTLSQLDGVEKVEVTVMGKSLPEGTGALAAEDLLLTGETPDPITLGFQIYFPLASGEGLGTEYREAELAGTELEDQIDAVIQLLVLGPQHTEEMSAPFEGLELELECEMVDEVCLITLTESWTEVLAGDPYALQALVNSLCELEGIRALAFDATGEGEQLLTGTFEAVYD